MYLFKQDSLCNGVIYAKEINQWKQTLNNNDKSLKEITTPKTKTR